MIRERQLMGRSTRDWLKTTRDALALAVVCSLVGCASGESRAAAQASSRSATSRPSTGYDEAQVFAHNSWYLRIRENGSGLYGFGSARMTPFPLRTFRFANVLGELLAVSSAGAGSWSLVEQVSDPESYGISLARPGTSLTDVRNTRDVDLVRRLFEQAMAATPPEPELSELLRTRPPFPPRATTQSSPTTKPAPGP
jgi:hypothetical protein